MAQHANTRSFGRLMKLFLPYLKPYAGIFALDLVCAGLTTVFELVFPQIVKAITQRGMENPAALEITFILKLGALLLLLRLFDAVCNYYMNSVGHRVGARVETDMRRDFFDHLQKLSHSYYDDTKIGQLMSRITADLFDITEFAHHCPEAYLISILKIAGAFCILAGTNLWLTLIIFSMMPLMFFFGMMYNMRMRDTNRRSRVQVGDLNAQVEDSLLGIRVVKSFANEDVERRKFNEGNRKFYDIKKLFYHYMGLFSGVTRLFDGVMYIAVVIVGALFMRSGAIDAAELITYLLYVTTVLGSVRTIVDFTELLQRGLTGIERFAEVMDTPPEIADAPDAAEFSDVRGEVVFDGVSFRYAENSKEVLSDIDMTVRAGDGIAIVGPSGGGKSTLCSLIPRFYEVTAGRILIDGRDIRSVTLKSLRDNIGVVQQDVYLFSGSVAENIEYGRIGASRDEIVEAAKLAGAHEFIEGLPQGYDTYVGERGVKLSGGQKQRISIARVFLKNPPILILDEATSSLDNESERVVQQSLDRLARGRTTFTIAHRLSTIRNAARILVLTENGIEEQGTHAELLEKKGVYAMLYAIYDGSGAGKHESGKL